MLHKLSTLSLHVRDIYCIQWTEKANIIKEHKTDVKNNSF